MTYLIFLYFCYCLSTTAIFEEQCIILSSLPGKEAGTTVTEAASRAPQDAPNLQMTALLFSHPAELLLYSFLIPSLSIAVPHFFTFKFAVSWLHCCDGSLTAPYEHFQHG